MNRLLCSFYQYNPNIVCSKRAVYFYHIGSALYGFYTARCMYHPILDSSNISRRQYLKELAVLDVMWS